MENPIKSLSVSGVLKGIVLFVTIVALFELAGLSAWLFAPVASFKAKFLPAKSVNS